MFYSFFWLMKRKFLSNLAFLLDHRTKFAQETYTLNDRSDNLFLIGECAHFLLTEYLLRIFTYAKFFDVWYRMWKKNVKAHRVNTMCRDICTYSRASVMCKAWNFEITLLYYWYQFECWRKNKLHTIYKKWLMLITSVTDWTTNAFVFFFSFHFRHLCYLVGRTTNLLRSFRTYACVSFFFNIFELKNILLLFFFN